jgi:zinc D-Ala-D-Ala carboxypeptidase
MGDLTPNFSRHQFACKGTHCCGHSAPIALQLVIALQSLHDKLSHDTGRDVPIFIISGFRCKTHDIELAITRGLSPAAAAAHVSQHCLGLGTDIECPSVGPDALAAAAATIPAFRDGGIGRYTGRRKNTVHVDTRTNGPARWTQ